jgi:hypothetical protein
MPRNVRYKAPVDLFRLAKRYVADHWFHLDQLESESKGALLEMPTSYAEDGSQSDDEEKGMNSEFEWGAVWAFIGIVPESETRSLRIYQATMHGAISRATRAIGWPVELALTTCRVGSGWRIRSLTRTACSRCPSNRIFLHFC